MPRNGGPAKARTKTAAAPKAASAAKDAKRTAPRPTADGAATPAASRREQRRLLHQDLSRTQLLDAAEEVFGEKGFHDTTLKEIAELAEFSVGSVYSFFENKDDLFLNVLLRRGAEFLPGMEAVINGPGTPREILHALVDYEIGFFREHPHFGRLYIRSGTGNQPGPETPASPELLANYQQAMDSQTELFARGQASGEFRDGDPTVLGRLFTGLILAYQSLDPAVVSDDEEGERLSLAALHDIMDGAFRRP
jgi:AcrR family transcriptional regulator